MPADYHTHTPLCHHATGRPEEFINAAQTAGLTEYGISDHAPMPQDHFDDWRMNLSDLPQYLAWVEQAQHHANENLKIKIGLECDWISGNQDIAQWNEQLQNLHSWDYLIGSVHYLSEGFDFDNPKWIGRLTAMDADDLWQAYWKSYREMAQTQLFDILGHPDLIKKFGHRPNGDLKRFYEPTIQTILDHGRTIEINTAGWHKPCNEQYPAFDFLTLAAEARIPLVISSDAHDPSEVARDRKRAIKLAQNAGFQNLSLFNQRQRSHEPL